MGIFDRGKVSAEAKQNALIREMERELAAVHKSMGMIEFSPDGIILNANDNFLKLMGYTLDEVKGQHHSMFVDPIYHKSTEYLSFLEKLGSGVSFSAQYKRIGVVKKEVWIQATYNPVTNANGNPHKIIKFVTDITEQKKQAAIFEGQLIAINKSMAVLELSLDGIIISANDNFLHIMGFTQDEIRGKHHRILVGSNYSESPEYRQLWGKLVQGEHCLAQEKLLGKKGQEVDFQASYNPILDPDGKPFKIIQFVTDITWEVKATQALTEAIAQAQNVIGTARSAGASQQISLGSKANELASLCSEINALVKDMADALVSIKESSAAKSITNGSSFKSKMSVLNSTAEAPRSGEERQGIAVAVAEVRNLSQRSASAVNNLRKLIANGAAIVESEATQVVSSGSSIDTLAHKQQSSSPLFVAPIKATTATINSANSTKNSKNSSSRAKSRTTQKTVVIEFDEWEGF